ncbi:hypothetical protein [Metabacillus sp. 84]|uniref:hypothetical protein n=1 Tax=unclassified Metabacillus TaxID=2675274 RepID=UPI003CEA81BC
MLGNEEFQLITRALDRSYEQLSGQEEGGAAGMQSIGIAKEELLQAMAHASSVEKKLIMHTLYNRC